MEAELGGLRPQHRHALIGITLSEGSEVSNPQHLFQKQPGQVSGQQKGAEMLPLLAPPATEFRTQRLDPNLAAGSISAEST